MDRGAPTALRRTYEIAAEMQPYEAAWLTQSVDRISREVRRVRALADSPPRLVRVTTWRGQSGEEYATRAEAVADKSHGGCRLTRITRIRRATP